MQERRALPAALLLYRHPSRLHSSPFHLTIKFSERNLARSTPRMQPGNVLDGAGLWRLRFERRRCGVFDMSLPGCRFFAGHSLKIADENPRLLSRSMF